MKQFLSTLFYSVYILSLFSQSPSATPFQHLFPLAENYDLRVMDGRKIGDDWLLLFTGTCKLEDATGGISPCYVLSKYDPSVTGLTNLDTVYGQYIPQFASFNLIGTDDSIAYIAAARGFERDSLIVTTYDLTGETPPAQRTFALPKPGKLDVDGALLHDNQLYIHGQFWSADLSEGAFSYIQKLDNTEGGLIKDWHLLNQRVPGGFDDVRRSAFTQDGKLTFSQKSKRAYAGPGGVLRMIKVDPATGMLLDSVQFQDATRYVPWTELFDGTVAMYFTHDQRRRISHSSFVHTFDEGLDTVLASAGLYNNLNNPRDYSPRGVTVTRSGSILIYGEVYDASIDNYDCTSRYAWLTKISADGQRTLWTRIYKYSRHPNDSFDQCRSLDIVKVIEDREGEYQLLGSSYWQRAPGDGLLRGSFLLTVDTFGCMADRPCEMVISVNDTTDIKPSMFSPGYTWTLIDPLFEASGRVIKQRIARETTDLGGLLYYNVEYATVSPDSGNTDWQPTTFYLRPEGGKVHYAITADDNIFNVDTGLLYDFDLEMGDTFAIPSLIYSPHPPDQYEGIVTAVDSVQLLNGETRRRITVSCNAFGEIVSGADDQWIEGMGGTYSFYGPDLLCSVDIAPGLLACYSLNDTVLYSNVDDCNDIQVSIREPQVHTKALRLYPNPATHTVTLDGAGAGPLHVVIYNLRGQRLRATLLSGRVLDVGDLPGGVYVVRTTDASGRKRWVGRLFKR